MIKKIQITRTLPPLKAILSSADTTIGVQKVRLQPWDVVDCEKLHDMVQRNRVALARFMPWIHYPMNFEELVHWIARARADYFSGTSFLWAIINDETAEIIGNISLRFVGQYRNPNAMEIGYWMDQEHSGKGFMTLACKMVIVLGFFSFALDRIQISCNKENLASRRVIEKCGFRFEGEIRNCFSKPTEKMLEEGYEKERSELSYSLISEDLSSLAWFQPLASSITLHTLLGTKSWYKDTPIP